MPFTAAISGSISEVMKPQAKNRLVTTMKAPTAPRPFLVSVIAWFPLPRFDHSLENMLGREQDVSAFQDVLAGTRSACSGHASAGLASASQFNGFRNFS